MTVIQNEHPQTLALILSYANAEQASQIIASLPREVRVDVVERIANMERAQPHFIKNCRKCGGEQAGYNRNG